MVGRILLAAAVSAALFAGTAQAAKPVTDRQIQEARERTWSCQDALGVKRTPASKKRPQGKLYRAWVLRLWQERARSYCGVMNEANRTPAVAIRIVFGSYAGQALAVASCESGHRTWAQNGQYLGMFQMGSSERALYGHGSTPLAQARAAWKYFVRSGRDWSPWSCKPW
jgi:hypothetical protein